MFGIKHKLNDGSLYLLHDMIEGIVIKAEEELGTCKDEKRAAELKAQIGYYYSEMKAFEDEIENQRKEMFQFSVEELYFMYGQYENRFIGVEFHKLSQSAKKFGREIGGVIEYKKSEREDLEKVLKSGTIPRTNGMVKFDVTSNYNLSKDQHDELLNNGFLSGDVYQINSLNLPVQKSYKQEGAKEIPNTINVEFDPTGMDPHWMEFVLLTKRLESKYGVIEAEWNKLCGYSLFYRPESLGLDAIKQRAFDAQGKKKTEVRYYELTAKMGNLELPQEEYKELYSIAQERKSVRMEMFRDELKKSTNRKEDQFAKEFPDQYKTILINALTFEDETLVYHNCFTPIYWDFKSFLHIYLRHFEELQIDGHFKNKTKFQYNKKDIKRILVIAIEKELKQINERLSQGKDFRAGGDRSLYFNGNYYAMRIEENGRVDSFNPLTDK